MTCNLPSLGATLVVQWLRLHFQCRGTGSIPGQGTEIPHAVLCCCSLTQSCPTLCDPMDCSMPGFSVHQHLPELAQTHVHRVGDVIQPSHLILCLPFLLLSLIFPSIKAFSNVSVRIRWTKYWSFSFSISASNEYSVLIFFRMDCLDLLAVQGTLKSLLQHHSSTASILRCSAFFIVQL